MDTTTIPESECELEIDFALARSFLYSALAAAQRLPGAALDRFYRGGGAEMLVRAARWVPAAGGLAGAAEAQVDAIQSTPAAELAAVHGRLFGHTTRGKVAPYETEFGGAELFRQFHDLADVNGFYHAFGLEMRPGAKERNDHVSAECEFMAFLAAREAQARLQGDAPGLEVTLAAQRSFFVEHLGRFGIAFARSLETEAPQGFYSAAGSLLGGLLKADGSRLGVKPGSEFLSLRSTEDDGVPMACGSSCSLAREACGGEEG